jgi:hypothetical protein
MIQTAHGATPPLDRPATEYPTCVTIPGPLHQVSYSYHDPATCTPRDKKTRFSKRNKDKRKTKQNYPRFEFKPRQVNDSSQSNQGTDHLVSQFHNRAALFSLFPYCCSLYTDFLISFSIVVDLGLSIVSMAVLSDGHEKLPPHHHR